MCIHDICDVHQLNFEVGAYMAIGNASADYVLNIYVQQLPQWLWKL